MEGAPNEEGGPDVRVEEVLVPQEATADAMPADAGAADAMSADASAEAEGDLSADLKGAPASDHSEEEEESYASPQEQLRRSHDSTPLHSSDYSEPSGNDESTHDGYAADDAGDQWSNSDIYDEPALDAQFREGYH